MNSITVYTSHNIINFDRLGAPFPAAREEILVCIHHRLR